MSATEQSSLLRTVVVEIYLDKMNIGYGGNNLKPNPSNHNQTYNRENVRFIVATCPKIIIKLEFVAKKYLNNFGFLFSGNVLRVLSA